MSEKGAGLKKWNIYGWPKRIAGVCKFRREEVWLRDVRADNYHAALRIARAELSTEFTISRISLNRSAY